MAALGPDFQPDIAKFKTYVAGNRLTEVKDKSCVLVLGLMGSGKSTTISIQQGAEKTLIMKNRKPDFATTWSNVATPQCSDGFVSKTLNVGVYEDREGGLLYLDTAGLNENRGPNERMWTNWCTASILSLPKELRAVVVCVGFADTFGGRGDALRRLGDCLSNILGTNSESQVFYDSMVFVFTNPFAYGQMVSLDDIERDVTSVLEAEKQKAIKSLRDMKKEFPKDASTLRALGAMGSKLTGGTCDTEMSDLISAIDWDAVPEQYKAEYNSAVSTKRMLEAIKNNRSFISWPKDMFACRNQRKALTIMIQGVPSIKKDKLAQILANRTTSRLSVCQTLARLVTTRSEPLNERYLDIAKRQAGILSTYAKLMSDKADILVSIKRNFEAVQKQLIQAQQEQKHTLSSEISNRQRQMARLRFSEEKVVYHIHEVRKGRQVTWNPLSWFGMSSARANYTYSGEWFLEYQTQGNHFTATVNNLSAKKGRLDIDFESSSGHDLKVDVKLKRYEKDLPVTQERIQVLEQQVNVDQQSLKVVQDKIDRLDRVRSKEELTNVVMEEERALEVELRAIEHNLRKNKLRMSEGGEAHVPSEFDAYTKSAELLTLMKSMPRVFLSDLSSAPMASIDEFVGRHQHAENLQTKLKSEKHSKGYVSFLEVRTDTRVMHMEDEQPVNSWAFTASLIKDEADCRIRSVWSFLSSRSRPFISEHRVPVAVAVLVLSFKGSMLQVIAVFVLVEVLINNSEHFFRFVSTTTDSNSNALRNFATEMNQSIDRTSTTMGDAVKTVSSNVAENTRINVDVSDNPNLLSKIAGIASTTIGGWLK